MADVKFHRISFDSYPALNTELADEFSSAVVDAYISPINDFGLTKNIEIVTNMIREEGWVVDSVICSSQIDEENLEEISAEVIQKGNAYYVNRVQVERMWLSGVVAVSKPSHELSDFLRSFSRTGVAFSLYSYTENQYANGVSPNGEEFLPLWTSEESARQWTSHFPSYVPKALSFLRYKEWIYPELVKNEMIIAIGTTADCLFTAHPRVVCDEVDIAYS